MSLHI